MIRAGGILVVAALAVSPCAQAAAPETSLTDTSLVGKWVVNIGECSDPNAEFITFLKSGAVESTRNGSADAVGFWRLENDRIYLNVLTTPARLHEKLKDVSGYYPFDITVATFNVTADSFQGVGVLDDQTRYGKFTRCKP
ncbi:MAG: hypothetical protein RKK15_06845 [Defluviicoccus sp.]|nr:hypothetical protein [Defluviicoccus sp.]